MTGGEALGKLTMLRAGDRMLVSLMWQQRIALRDAVDRYDSARRKTLAALRERGYTLSQIAEVFSCSRQHVHNMLRRDSESAGRERRKDACRRPRST